jgi:hypothetical protein
MLEGKADSVNARSMPTVLLRDYFFVGTQTGWLRASWLALPSRPLFPCEMNTSRRTPTLSVQFPVTLGQCNTACSLEGFQVESELSMNQQ